MFDWIEWKGEKVGDMHNPVCACLMTYLDNRCIYAILPRAYCCTEGDPEGKGWCYFEGDTSRYHSITYHESNGKWVKVFDHTRGDKIFYCKPHLPDGTKFELNDIKKRQFKGWAVVKEMHVLRTRKD